MYFFFSFCSFKPQFVEERLAVHRVCGSLESDFSNMEKCVLSLNILTDSCCFLKQQDQRTKATKWIKNAFSSNK